MSFCIHVFEFLYENHVKVFFKLTTTCDISFLRALFHMYHFDLYMHFSTYLTSIIIIIIIFTIIIIILCLQYLIQIQIICFLYTCN